LLAEPATQLVLHLGSASVPVHVRMLGETAARLTLSARYPLQVGDRGVLRDPGQQTVIAGVEVLDPDPPPLNRRGAGRQRGAELADRSAASVIAQVHRRGAVRQSVLSDLGYDVTPTAGVLTRSGWLVSEPVWKSWLAAMERAVDDQAVADPLRPWVTEEAARRALGIADPSVVVALASEAGLALGQGRIGRPDARPALAASGPALLSVLHRLQANPFDAPARDELAELGLGTRDLAAAERAGQLIRLAPDLVVAADALTRARETLDALPQPFTTSQARQALGTTRRIAVPLLERLDRMGITVRGEADTRWTSPVPTAGD
jgi:selenocysteine-specific elongation factor